MAIIKNPAEIEILKKGGAILSLVLNKVVKEARVGVSTAYLNELAESLIIKAGAIPSFKGFGERNPYPAALCTSINQEVVHCIPQPDRFLQEGDIIGLDLGVKYPPGNGLFTDKAITVGVGKVSPQAKKLIKVTKKVLDLAIKSLKPGMTTGDLGLIIQNYVESKGLTVVRELVGHGVGYAVHEPPHLPNFGQEGEGEVIEEGMVLALEPMVNTGGWKVKFSENGWNVETEDGSLSAHFEHTILVTKNGCEILTK